MSLNAAKLPAVGHSLPLEGEDKRKINIAGHASLLLIVSIIGLISNWVATGIDPIAALPGMAILYVVSVAGLFLTRFVPFYLPSVAWISLLAIIITVPGVPGADWVVAKVEALNFLALATPALAYGGLALTKGEFDVARTSGWKIVIVAICVMLGTYLGSVVIADVMLRISG